MRAYVLGAGASYPRYPLGGELLNHIGAYIRGCGRCFNRFHYDQDRTKALEWLEQNADPLLRQAYATGNIEQVFTALDLAELLVSESLISILRAGKWVATRSPLPRRSTKRLEPISAGSERLGAFCFGHWRSTLSRCTAITSVLPIEVSGKCIRHESC